MTRQSRRTGLSVLVLAALVGGLAFPASAQAEAASPADGASTVATDTEVPSFPGEEEPAPAPEPEPETTEVPSEPIDPGGVPGIPTEEPTTPTEPTQPSEPSNPTQPTEPSNPTQPQQPAPQQPAPQQPAPQQPAPQQPAPQPAQPQQPAQGGGNSGGSGSGTGGGGSGGTTGGTATTEAGSSAPRSSAPGTTLLSTSSADPAAAPTTDAPASEAGSPAVSVFLTRDAGVDPGALTVDLARFYGVGVAYAGFQREENATATLKAPAGTETALTVENRQDGESSSTGSATVPSSALVSIGAYTVTVTGDRGSSSTTSFSLAASSGPGILVEPRESSSAEAATPRGAVWGFGPVESVSVGAFTTAGVRADLAAGALSVRVDALGWSDLALGDAIVAEPTASVYCIVAVGSVSKRTAAVTVVYPEGDAAADVPEASQVCGIAITSAKNGLVAPTAASGSGGLSAGVGLTIGAGVLVAALIAGLVTAVVLRRRREDQDLLIGGPLPHATEE